MGQKVHPYGIRLGIVKDWEAQWYGSKKEFSGKLYEDNLIRKTLKKQYYHCAISKITISRSQDNVMNVNIYTGRPGTIIGKGGSNVSEIKANVLKLTDCQQVNINIREIKSPDKDAQLAAEAIASQLEKRVQHRRAMKGVMQRAMMAGALGIKTMAGGRLEGAEIARREFYREGSIPLQTLRANIDYGFAEAHTTFGVIGVKVWIYHGEVIGKVNTREGGNA